MLGGRGRDGTICGCFETFVQTDHLGGGLETPDCGGAGGAWGLPWGRALPRALLHPKFGIDPSFGLSGLRQPRQPQLLLRPWPRREGDVQRLTSCPQRGEQTNFKNRLKIFTGSGPLSARRLRAAPAEAEEEPRRGRERGHEGVPGVPGSVRTPSAAGDVARARDSLSFQRGVQILRLYVRAFVPLRV